MTPTKQDQGRINTILRLLKIASVGVDHLVVNDREDEKFIQPIKHNLDKTISCVKALQHDPPKPPVLDTKS